MSNRSDLAPPRGYLSIDAAAQLLTHGGTLRALSWAEAFLRMVADVQGLAVGSPAAPRLRWWQATDGILRVNMHDVPALREEFARWTGGHLPADEWAEPVPAARGTEADVHMPPVPTTRRPGRPALYPYELLEIGKSFSVDVSKRDSVCAGSLQFSRLHPEYKFLVRTMRDRTVRVWRVA
jgi:hypothetical protein